MRPTNDVQQFLQEIEVEPMQAVLDGILDPDLIGLPSDVNLLRPYYTKKKLGAIGYWAILCQLKPNLPPEALNKLAHLGLTACQGYQVEKYFAAGILSLEECKPYVYMYLDNFPKSPVYFLDLGFLTEEECLKLTLATEQPNVIYALYEKGRASVAEVLPTLLALFERDLYLAEPKEFYVISTIDYYYQNIPPLGREDAMAIVETYLRANPQFIPRCKYVGFIN